MKRLITYLSLLILTMTATFAQEYDQLIVTYTGKNALISVQKSDFSKNTFELALNIKWVNNNLQPTPAPKDVLGVHLAKIKTSPENSLVLLNTGEYSDFSNKIINLKFSINPRFSGGNVKIEIPIVTSPSITEANNLVIKPPLFTKPQILTVNYYIDSSKIVDVFPPTLEVLYPKINPNIDKDYPVVNSKYIEFHLSAVDKSGVKQVLIDHRLAKMQFPGHFVQDIKLSTGLNTIHIEATDNVGNKATLDYDILCTYQYDINLHGGKFYAVLIAENDYKDDNIPDLNNPIHDAQKLYNVLVKDYSFDTSTVFFMKNPTRSQIIRTLDQLSNNITDNDNLLVFYAGHGYWDEFKQIGYWMPSDAKLNDKSTWLRNSTIKDYIGAIHSLHTLLITDACFSGSIFKTRGIQEAKKIVAYQKIYQLPSRKAMTSGTLKEVPDKSIFLETLVNQLRANTSRYLPASRLFEQVRFAVLNNTPNVPQYGTIQDVGDQGGEFIFIHKK